MSLLDQMRLPNEIYIQIFDYLSVFERINISKASKQFRILVQLINPFKKTRILIKRTKHWSFYYSFYTPVIGHMFLYYNEDITYSIICRKNSIILDNGYFQSYTNGRSYRQKVEYLYLKTNDQIYLHNSSQLSYITCKNRNRIGYYDGKKQSVNPAQYPVYITMSESDILYVYFDSVVYKYNCGPPIHGIHIYNMAKSQTDHVSCGELYNMNPIMAACDTNENIYILDKQGFIHKFNYRRNFVKYIHLIITEPHWISINQDRLFVCNKNSIHVCDLDGIVLFKIDKVFRDLRCLAFNRDNNILLVDGHRVLRLYKN